MSYKKYLGLGAALVSLSAIPVSDVHAFTGTAGASATIVTAVNFTNDVVLHFGEFTYSGAGTVAIQTTTGNRTPGGSVTGVVGAANETAGNLAVTGGNGLSVQIDFPASATITHSIAADTMSINTFQVNTDAGGTVATVTIGGGGTVDVPYGATLNVAGTEATGQYNGTFNVIANYN